MTATTNFEFIARSYPDLHQLAGRIENYYHLDRNTCAAKLRLFAELYVGIIANNADYQQLPQQPLQKNISWLQSIKAAPQWVVELLHELRTAGNQAVHTTSGDAPAPLARNLVEQLIKKAMDLAEFLHTQFEGGSAADVPQWRRPPAPGEDRLFRLAFEDDAEACFELGSRCNVQLQHAYQQRKGAISQELRATRIQLMRDTLYWLDKSAAQQHHPALLLLAQIASGNLSTPHQAEQAEHFFQRAVLSGTPDGLYAYAIYLQTHERGDKWRRYMERAAKAGHLPAVHHLQEYWYSRDPDRYQRLVERGLELNDKRSCTLKVLSLDWADEANTKPIRTLIIQGNAQREPSIPFFEGLLMATGHAGNELNIPGAFELLEKHTATLPEFLTSTVKPAVVAYITGKKTEQPVHRLLPLAEAAVVQVRGSEKEAELCFLAAMDVIVHVSDGNTYRGPLEPRRLIARSAELRYEPAIHYKWARQGKCVPIICSRGTKPVDRKKIKQRRKARAKARRR